MRRKRHSRRLLFGFAAATALVLSATVGIYRVMADAGFSSAIDVDIFSPVSSGGTISLTGYSPNAQVPPSIPIGVKSLVSDLTVRGGATVDITSVQTVLGGDLSGNQITGEDQSREATLVNFTSSTDEFLAVVDARLLDFAPVTRGTSAPIAASDFIRTVAIASGYYSARTVSNIAELDTIGVDITLRDLAEVDTDGNLIPDASALFDPFLLCFDTVGNITIVLSLDDTVVRGAPLSYELSLQTVLGPINVGITASSLSEIIAESGGSLSVFNTGRLIITLTDNPAEVIDSPAGTNPLGEFDLEEGGSLLPPPQNLFVRVNVALSSVARGTSPSWTFLSTLPGDAFFSLDVNGPGIAALLSNGSPVAAYTYNVDIAQSSVNGENIFVSAPDPLEGWVDISDGVSLFDLDNADDAADGVRVQLASNGDDTIVITGNNVSTIYGSNAIPRIGSAGGGGDGDGLCFIATAAFGTPLAREITALRNVRDEYMLTNPFGSLFADTYYRLSPPVASEVAQSAALKSIVRTALLPAVALSRWLLSSPASLLIALASAGTLLALLRRTRRA